MFKPSLSDSISIRGNEGGGLGAEAPALNVMRVKLETTSPYFIIEKVVYQRNIKM